LILRLRQFTLLTILGMSLAGLALPVASRAQGTEPAGKDEKSEPRHELLFHTINFIILIGGLGYVLRKPMAEFFSGRSAAINKALDEGRKALEASQAQLRAAERKLRGLEAEIAALQSTAEREMSAERQRLQQSGAEEATRILESARAQIDSALRAAKLELRSFAAQQSVARAEELIRTRLDDAGRRRLVTQFAATVGSKDAKN
jgi:F-type H+-transporting ATPase subunit b